MRATDSYRGSILGNMFLLCIYIYMDKQNYFAANVQCHGHTILVVMIYTREWLMQHTIGTCMGYIFCNGSLKSTVQNPLHAYNLLFKLGHLYLPFMQCSGNLQHIKERLKHIRAAYIMAQAALFMLWNLLWSTLLCCTS